MIFFSPTQHSAILFFFKKIKVVQLVSGSLAAARQQQLGSLQQDSNSWAASNFAAGQLQQQCLTSGWQQYSSRG
jgi:hypothetical protein